MSKLHPVLTIVVPCFNEQEVLGETTRQLTETLQQLMTDHLISSKSSILLVDDGSKDQTWNMIVKATINHRSVAGLKLARNVGHQSALYAGLEKAKDRSDCVISIDADLQDDVSAIRTFVAKYLDGYDIVYGVRSDRQTDTAFKRTTAQAFYRSMQKIGINLVYNHADFRLMSKRALEELCKYKETNLFLRGIVPLLGFKSTEVAYTRKERHAGNTKYPLKRMLSFAFDGVTSFSIAPIRFISFLGMLLFMCGVVTGGYALMQKLTGNANAGWTSLMVSIWFIGGLQLIGIGIIGEYIGRVFLEVKGRPKYAVDIDLYTNNDLLEKHSSQRDFQPIKEQKRLQRE
ncbi:glycosyltransferase family 2 protein [Sediminibacillus massiliensis]|uniref:glycosyltransferase family 2 protein n=1 Tax=Sediminibacillus massiliensis TaxID=1926277 RepID=UPI0009882E3B|nr:glycosyltransferase family 2 protein [Sediminibacillus massiliensis]